MVFVTKFPPAAIGALRDYAVSYLIALTIVVVAVIVVARVNSRVIFSKVKSSRKIDVYSSPPENLFRNAITTGETEEKSEAVIRYKCDK